MLYLLQGGREGGRPPSLPPSLPARDTTYKLTICCCITETYNKVFIVLTYNFSKEQYVLPEDDLRIETCRSVLHF